MTVDLNAPAEPTRARHTPVRASAPVRPALRGARPQYGFDVPARTALPVVQVVLHGEDVLARDGLADVLHQHPRLRTTTEPGPHRSPHVVVLVEDRPTPARLRAWAQAAHDEEASGTTGDVPRTVLVCDDLNDLDVLVAVDTGIGAVLSRAAAADRPTLVATLLAVADGGAILPRRLQGVLADQVRRLRREVLTPHGLTLSGLTVRECDVLRLVADGLDTREVADRLAFSERTVKYVLNHLQTRLHLRTRAQAVAHAVRVGAI